MNADASPVTARLPTRVTYLQMFERPPAAEPDPLPGVGVVRAIRPTLSFYRYLYDTIGEQWVWTVRRLANDAALRRLIHNPLVEIHVLWVDGVPAGMAELNLTRPHEVEMVYFGLLPDFIGRGLGRWFLGQVVHLAWDAAPDRVWVHTCDLDHPRALPNYEAAGFTRYAERDEETLLLPGMPLPPHRQDLRGLLATKI